MGEDGGGGDLVDALGLGLADESLLLAKNRV